MKKWDKNCFEQITVYIYITFHQFASFFPSKIIILNNNNKHIDTFQASLCHETH